jgi:peptidoglycan/xylan/chitin deacetylase (PgdA/CDA1 family)
MDFRGVPDERELELRIFVQGLLRDLHRVDDYVWLHSRWYTDDDYAKVLDVGKKTGSRFTFCFLGRDVQFRKEVIRRMVDEGHEVATHGPRHYRMDASLSKERISSAVGPCVEELRALGADAVGFWSAYNTVVATSGMEALRDVGIEWFSSGMAHPVVPEGIRFVPLQGTSDYHMVFIDRMPIDEAEVAWKKMSRDTERGAMLFHPFTLTRLTDDIRPAFARVLEEAGGSVPMREWPASDGRPSVVFDASLQLGWW